MPCRYVINFEMKTGEGRRNNRLPFSKLTERFSPLVEEGRLRLTTGHDGNMLVSYRDLDAMPSGHLRIFESLGGKKTGGPFRSI